MFEIGTSNGLLRPFSGTLLFWPHFRWNLLQELDLGLFKHCALRLLVEGGELLVADISGYSLLIFDVTASSIVFVLPAVAT